MDAAHQASGRPAAGDCFADGARGEWHILHVRSRQEKALAADLAAIGIPHFLPLVPHARVYGRRRAVIHTPLFPGYVFVRGTRDDAYRCDRTRRVAGIIHVPDQRGLERELCNLRAALDAGAALDPCPFVRDGVRVVVRDGPLRGLTGVAAGGANAVRLVLQVQVLGRAVSVPVGEADLELETVMT